MLVDTDDRLQTYARRTVLGLLALAGVGVSSATAWADAGDMSTKGGAWLLGDKLSIAALLYDQNASPSTIDNVLGRAKGIARILGLEIPPFPAKAATSAASSAQLLHYLIAGDGARLGQALTRRYDSTHGILFELAVKSNLLISLYGPGDSIGLSIADVIKSRSAEIGLPRPFWTNLVALIESQGSQHDVKDAVFKMHADVANYFIPGAGR